MIQAILFFVLGFLVATALALAVAPALWRRAGRLARRRIEASMPITQEERQAQIDAIHAEHAMAMRRLEMKAEAIKKKAAQDLVEINLLREQVRGLQEECAARDEAVARLQTEYEHLTGLLAEGEAERCSLAEKLSDTEDRLADSEGEVEKLSRFYEEASLTGSALQVQLVAREGEIERLNDTIKLLRHQRKEADRTMHEALADKTHAEEALRIERDKVPELERKIESLMTNLSTREEVLERQTKEITRLKQKIRQNAAGDIDAMEEAKAKLEMKVAELSMQVSTLLAEEGSVTKNRELPAARKPEVERLRSRLATLTRENKKLRAELAASEPSARTFGDEELRERISDLAAEVVSVAAVLEGPDSPIEKALSQPAPVTDGDRPLSLAERVRALRGGSAAAE